MNNEVKENLIPKNPFTLKEIGVLENIMKKFIDSAGNQDAFQKASSRLKMTSKHMEAYSFLEEFYQMLPKDKQENFAVPLGDLGQTKEEEDLIMENIESDNPEEVIKMLSELFNKNKDKLDMIKFVDLKDFHETLTTQVKVFESMNKILTKCELITDCYGDQWEGELDNAFKER